MKIKKSDIKIKRMTDEDPDLSYLGEYSSNPRKNAIDRVARGDAGRNEFRYCNITMSAEDTGNPDSVEQDYQRLEAYNSGEWCTMGIFAECSVIIGGVFQQITSGGLWGIESDSDGEYLASVEAEQIEELLAILAEMGVEVEA